MSTLTFAVTQHAGPGSLVTVCVALCSVTGVLLWNLRKEPKCLPGVIVVLSLLAFLAPLLAFDSEHGPRVPIGLLGVPILCATAVAGSARIGRIALASAAAGILGCIVLRVLWFSLERSPRYAAIHRPTAQSLAWNPQGYVT